MANLRQSTHEYPKNLKLHSRFSSTLMSQVHSKPELLSDLTTPISSHIPLSDPWKRVKIPRSLDFGGTRAYIDISFS